MHLPFTQPPMALAGVHVAPHAPQFSGSVFRSKPLSTTQVGKPLTGLHFAVAFAMLHATPQLPQFLVSFVRSKVSSTLPLQSLSSESQISTPPFDGVHGYSQPSEAMPFKSIYPAAHI